MAKTSRESYKFQLRLPDDLRDRVRVAAEENGRTLTAEIIETLTAKYPPLTIAEVQKRVEEIMKFIENAEPGYLPPGMMADFEELMRRFKKLQAEGASPNLEDN